MDDDRHAREGSADASPRVMLDPERRAVRVNDVLIPLTRLEWKLLYLLQVHAGRVVSNETIRRTVWGEEDPTSLKGTHLTSLVQRLRRKLEEDSGKPRYLITVRGHGYLFTTFSHDRPASAPQDMPPTLPDGG